MAISVWKLLQSWEIIFKEKIISPLSHCCPHFLEFLLLGLRVSWTDFFKNLIFFSPCFLFIFLLYFLECFVNFIFSLFTFHRCKWWFMHSLLKKQYFINKERILYLKLKGHLQGQPLILQVNRFSHCDIEWLIQGSIAI